MWSGDSGGYAGANNVAQVVGRGADVVVKMAWSVGWEYQVEDAFGTRELQGGGGVRGRVQLHADEGEGESRMTGDEVVGGDHGVDERLEGMNEGGGVETRGGVGVGSGGGGAVEVVEGGGSPFVGGGVVEEV